MPSGKRREVFSCPFRRENLPFFCSCSSVPGPPRQRQVRRGHGFRWTAPRSGRGRPCSVRSSRCPAPACSLPGRAASLPRGIFRDPSLSGISLSWLRAGTLSAAGLIREAANPLGFAAASEVFREDTSLVLDGSVSSPSRAGILLMPVPGRLGIYCRKATGGGQELGVFASAGISDDVIVECLAGVGPARGRPARHPARPRRMVRCPDRGGHRGGRSGPASLCHGRLIGCCDPRVVRGRAGSPRSFPPRGSGSLCRGGFRGVRPGNGRRLSRDAHRKGLPEGIQRRRRDPPAGGCSGCGGWHLLRQGQATLRARQLSSHALARNGRLGGQPASWRRTADLQARGRGVHRQRS